MTPTIPVTNFDTYCGPQTVTVPWEVTAGTGVVVETPSVAGFVHQLVFTRTVGVGTLDIDVQGGADSIPATLWSENGLTTSQAIYPRVLEQSEAGVDLATRTRHYHAGPIELAITNATIGDAGALTIVLTPA
jgi:hypothetical protein